MNWFASIFEDLYTSINDGQINVQLFEQLVGDLENLLDASKIANQTSRATLEKGEITMSTDGSIYQVSQDFVVAAITLADELNVDELIVGELIISGLIYNDSVDQLYSQDQLTLVNLGKIQYFLRRQYILQITSYILNCLNPEDKLFTLLVSSGKLKENIFFAFKQVQKELDGVKQLVNKAQILENSVESFKQNIKFKRDFYLREYDILSQIQYALVKKNILLSKTSALTMLSNISELNPNDIFIVYHLPAILCLFQNLNNLSDADVSDLHSTLTKEIKDTETIYKYPAKVAMIFVFLTYFIGWCKADPQNRPNKYDFKTTVDDPMSLSIELGSIEQLMVFAADTSIAKQDKSLELFYDIRSLLERHIPRLIPCQLQDSIPSILSNDTHINSISNDSTVFENIEFSPETNAIFLTTFDDALRTIINHDAFLLTKLKDSEEDTLLSGEDLDLNDIAMKADLERFFITIYFFYSSRPQFSKQFWSNKESSTYGFIEWAAKCNDTLMRSCFHLMVSSLSFGSENALSVYYYYRNETAISWNIIAQCISEYIIKISNLNTEISQRQQYQSSTDINVAAIALDEGLNEESIIFLSSLLTLVHSVAYDLSEENKKALSDIFTNVLFEFCKIDTPLVGASLTTLSTLVPELESQRDTFWSSLDKLIFNNANMFQNSYRKNFANIFTNFSEVVGFLQLFNKLMKITTKEKGSEFLIFGKLQFPQQLGKGYRQSGIWPYLDYVMNELLVNARKIKDNTNARKLKLLIYQSINSALDSFDYSVMVNSMPSSINLNEFVVSSDFYKYILENPSISAFNYLFTENVYDILFQSIMIGTDQLESDLTDGRENIVLLEESLRILSTILKYQETYIEELVPIIERQQRKGYFIPNDFGLHGLRSYYDALFFNLPLMAHLGLYVGLNVTNIVQSSIWLLRRIASHNYSRLSYNSNTGKLLTIFDSVDESIRIKKSFINQLQSNSISHNESMPIKLSLLNFINSNLSYYDQSVTISHFLLGFQTSNNISLGPDIPTFISSDESLLKSIIDIIKVVLTSISSQSINYNIMNLLAESFEIILKLLRNPTTAHLIVDFFDSQNLYEFTLNADIVVNKTTLFSGITFDTSNEESFKKFMTTDAMGTLLSFLRYRSYVLKFLSLTLFNLSNTGSGLKLKSDIEQLTSSKLYSAKLFNFLDILNFNLKGIENMEAKLSIFQNLSFNLNKIEPDISGSQDSIYDMSSVNSLLFLSKRDYLKKNTKSLLITSDEKVNLENNASLEMDMVKNNLTLFINYKIFEELQKSGLHAWSQLVQVMAANNSWTPLDRSSLVLEIFSTIVPMINEYVEQQVSFSEELVSLAVFLYDIYHNDQISLSEGQKMNSRLYTLFKTCISGILTSGTSFNLRSDFYILANKYLLGSLNDEKLSTRILQDVQLESQKLIELAYNDAIFGENTIRITSMFFLSSLLRLCQNTKENSLLEQLVKSHQLSLLVRSLKNTDLLLATSTVSIDDILYELTSFKSTLAFLTKLAQNKNGASALIQSNLLEVLGDCEFLMVDPDLGLNLNLDELAYHNSKPRTINVTLDNPLSISNNVEGVSLFEFLVPVFQLIASLTITINGTNEKIIKNVKRLLLKFRKLCVGVLKRDVLEPSKKNNTIASPQNEGLQQMVELIVLLCTLTGYQGEERLP